MEKNEDGLTLVEMMVALLVIGIVLTAMASVSIAAMHSMQRSEGVVHSTQLGNEVLEEYLVLPYDVLGHYATEAQNHFGSTTFEGEDLVIFPDPAERDDRVPYPSRTLTRNGVTFDVETAVTWVDDPATSDSQDYKRISVLLTWETRGETRTSRTEATLSPTPLDQPLAVTIDPDVLSIRSDGATDNHFEIRVSAKDPQSTVRVRWTRRDGTLSNWRDLSATDIHDLEWRTEITDNSTHARFANGGTLFEVEGTSAANERITTTIGRAVFLHPLEFPPDRLTTTPTTVWIDNDGVACEPLGITAEVIGALKSDPLTLTFEGQTENESLPFRAEAGLEDGARYHLDVDRDLVQFTTDAEGNELVRFDLLLLRAVDPGNPDGTEKSVTVEITDVQRLQEGETCPT